MSNRRMKREGIRTFALFSMMFTLYLFQYRILGSIWFAILVSSIVVVAPFFVKAESVEHSSGRKKVLIGSVIGILLGVVLSPSLDSLLLRRAMKRGDQIVSAVLRHEEMTGYYPIQIEELVPEYIDSLPKPGIEMLGGESFWYWSSPERDEFSLVFKLPDFTDYHRTHQADWQVWDR